MTTDHRLIEDALIKHPEATVALIERFDIEHISSLVEVLPWGQSCTILITLPPYIAGKVLTKILKDTAILLLDHLPLQHASMIMLQLDEENKKELLDGLPKQVAKNLRRTMAYPSDTIGAFLEPSVVFNEEISVTEALDKIKKTPEFDGSFLYVVGKKHRLKGYVPVTELISATPSDSLKLVMKDDPAILLPNYSVIEVLANWDYRFTILPVTDANGIFMGVVARNGLVVRESRAQSIDSDVVQAGNALGDLYLIGLTSLFGTSSQPIGKTEE
jgi:Mg/Co/Ni transporter MgtE